MRERLRLFRLRCFCLGAAVLACTAGIALAQDAQTTTPMQRQLSRIDFAISGAGEFTPTVSGKVLPANAPNTGTNVGVNASNTLGAVATLRYVARPFVGFEFNYGYARYTEDFTYPGPNFGVQTNAQEFTLGYVATPQRPIFGLQPFVSAGLGSTEFKPTRGGGQNLPVQARATYYYSVGLQQEVLDHFGVRASFRQLFFLAPDFGQNYLTIKQRSITSEPTVGFYLRF